MAPKVTLILALVSVMVLTASGQFFGGLGYGLGGPVGYGGGLGYGHGYSHYPQYSYGYGVNDAYTHDNKQASEHRNGAFVQTQYSQNIIHG